VFRPKERVVVVPTERKQTQPPPPTPPPPPPVEEVVSAEDIHFSNFNTSDESWLDMTHETSTSKTRERRSPTAAAASHYNHRHRIKNPYNDNDNFKDGIIVSCIANWYEGGLYYLITRQINKPASFGYKCMIYKHYKHYYSTSSKMNQYDTEDYNMFNSLTHKRPKKMTNDWIQLSLIEDEFCEDFDLDSHGLNTFTLEKVKEKSATRDKWCKFPVELNKKWMNLAKTKYLIRLNANQIHLVEKVSHQEHADAHVTSQPSQAPQAPAPVTSNEPTKKDKKEKKKDKKKNKTSKKEEEENIYKYMDSDRAVSQHPSAEQQHEDEPILIRSRLNNKKTNNNSNTIMKQQQQQYATEETNEESTENNEQDNDEINLKLTCIKQITRPTHVHFNASKMNETFTRTRINQDSIHFNFEYVYLVNNIFEW
jgi:hypothetical protein